MTAAKCSAKRQNGTACKNAPIHGGNVCRMHGGGAPQVKRKAEERIRDAADPAAAKIVQLMQNPKVPYVVQLAAARDLLDRAGISRNQTIGVEIRKFEGLVESGALLIDLPEPAALLPGRSGEKEVGIEDEAEWTARVEQPVKTKRRRRTE